MDTVYAHSNTVYAWRGKRYKTQRGIATAIRKEYLGRVSLGLREAHVVYSGGNTDVFDVDRERKEGNAIRAAYTLVTVLDVPHTKYTT